MNNVLILAAIGVIGVVLSALVARYRRERRADFGAVSATWIAELRAGDPYDSGR